MSLNIHLSKVLEEHRDYKYSLMESPSAVEQNLKSSTLAKQAEESFRREQDSRPMIQKKYGTIRSDSPEEKR